ncbi:MAG: hypothetical protein GY746_14435 [Gammaproteobacteria bacterium]|nr:hypothetical protein [Gammaproteobacteria bacterium]
MQTFVFNQIHIDVARNATDDFNLFHDKDKWRKINRNPFKGPIVLGFQLESLIEHNVRKYRRLNNENSIITNNHLRFSNYQFSFANAVKPNYGVTIDIKKSHYTTGENSTLSNRVSLRSENKLDLIGFKKESQYPLFLSDVDTTQFGDLANAPDRSFIHGGTLFLKRKFMNTSNAKNFLSGSLAEQADYFDELEGRANFPEIFPCGLISCALLEKAFLEQHDFQKNPMVYTAHKISIDRYILANLKSNDTLHILVKQVAGSSKSSDRVYECYGVVGSETILYRGIISLTYLENILDSINKKTRHK